MSNRICSRVASTSLVSLRLLVTTLLRHSSNVSKLFLPISQKNVPNSDLSVLTKGAELLEAKCFSKGTFASLMAPSTGGSLPSAKVIRPNILLLISFPKTERIESKMYCWVIVSLPSGACATKQTASSVSIP